MSISLRHEVLIDKSEALFMKLSATMADLREVTMEREYNLTTERYDSYFDPRDKTWASEFSGLIVREAAQCEAEAIFDFTFEQVHCERLTISRRGIDQTLIEVLRRMGWSEAKLTSLAESLHERANLIHVRRMEIVNYVAAIECRNDAIHAAMSVGHFSEACDLLRAMCEELDRKIAEVADQLSQDPVIGA